MESFAQTGSRDGSTSPCDQSGGRQTHHAVRRASRAGHPAPVAVRRSTCALVPRAAARRCCSGWRRWTGLDCESAGPTHGPLWVARLGLHGEWFWGWNLNVKCALLWKKKGYVTSLILAKERFSFINFKTRQNTSSTFKIVHLASLPCYKRF